MFHIKNSRIKNPLLKQLGNGNKKEKTQELMINDKKLNLELLIEFVNNFDKKDNSIDSIKNSDNNSNYVIDNIEPNIGEFISLNNLSKSLNEITEGIDIKRFGIIKSIPGKLKFYNNLSFISSLAAILNSKFVELDENSQINFIKSLKTYVYTTFTKSFYDKNNYKELSKQFNFDRLDISKNFYNYELTRNELLVISDIFHINLFIFDISRDKLFFTGRYFIPYKKNVFMLKKDDGFFEPLNIDEKFYVEHDNDLIQYLLENNHKVELYFKLEDNDFSIHCENLDKYTKEIDKEINLDIKNKILERRLFNLNRTDKDNLNNDILNNDILNNDILNNDINDYTENKNIPDYNLATEIKSLSDSEDDNTEEESDKNSDDKEINMKKKYKLDDLKNLKLAELSSIAGSMGINLTDGKKKKTKNILIEEILEN